jgi:hypothetical protein
LYTPPDLSFNIGGEWCGLAGADYVDTYPARLTIVDADDGVLLGEAELEGPEGISCPSSKLLGERTPATAARFSIVLSDCGITWTGDATGGEEGATRLSGLLHDWSDCDLNCNLSVQRCR